MKGSAVGHLAGGTFETATQGLRKDATRTQVRSDPLEKFVPDREVTRRNARLVDPHLLVEPIQCWQSETHGSWGGNPLPLTRGSALMATPPAIALTNRRSCARAHKTRQIETKHYPAYSMMLYQPGYRRCWLSVAMLLF